MPIAKRLTLALLIPVIVVIGIGALSWLQVARIGRASDFMADNVAPSLAALSHFSHDLARMEELVTEVVLSDDAQERPRRRAAFDAAHAAARAELDASYLVADEEDRRLLAAVRDEFGAWHAGALRIFALRGQGDAAGAQRALLVLLGDRERALQGALDRLVDYNEVLAQRARAGADHATVRAQRRQYVIVGAALALVIVIGLSAARGIVGPLRTLTAEVIAVARGDYGRVVPLRDHTDEIGELARSVETLRAEAATLAEERRGKAWLAETVTDLQGARTLEEFGGRLLGHLLAASGARAGAVYALRDDGEALERIATNGPLGPEAPAVVEVGQGLVGRAARDVASFLVRGGEPPRPVALDTTLQPGDLTAGPLVVGGEVVGAILTEVDALPPPARRVQLRELQPVASLMLQSLHRLARTERQAETLARQQEELRSTEAWFRQIVESAPGGMVITDDDGVIVFANRQVEVLLGYAPGELIGALPEVLLPPEARDAHRAHREAHVRATHGQVGQPPVAAAGDALRKDGRRMPCEIEVSRMATVPGRRGSVCIAIRDTTAKRVAEGEMRKLSSAIAQLSSSVVVTDLTGAIEYVNPAFTALTGYALDEVRGQNPRLLKSGRTPAEVHADLWATITAGRVWRGELHNRKKSGELFIESAVISPITDGHGRATHFVAIKEDITERKRVDRELELSQRIVENSPPMLWIDPETAVVAYANQAALEHFGYSAAELRGTRIMDWDPDFTVDDLHALYARLAQSGKAETFPTRQVRRSGEIVDMEITAYLAHDGERALLIANMVEVTDRKRAEEAVRRERARLQRLLDTAPVGVAITVGGRLRLANPRYRELVDLGVGGDVRDVYVRPAQRAEIMAALAREGVVRDVEVQSYGPGGAVRDIMATFLTTEYARPASRSCSPTMAAPRSRSSRRTARSTAS